MIEIGRPLLENMRIIDFKKSCLSEGKGEEGRRFELIRIYQNAPPQRSPAGRKPIYDWPELAGLLKREKFRSNKVAELVHWCRTNVKTLSGKSPSRDGPDDKTIRAAIFKYGLDKITGLKR
jgi:hypothetical protein